MRVSKYVGIGFSFAAMILFSPLPANASCVQADMAGNWQAYILDVSGTGSDWIHCAFKISADGTITNTICNASTEATGTLKNAEIKLSRGATCTFTGKFTTSGTVNTIKHATLAADKLTASGVGTSADAYFMMTLVKY